MPRFARNPKRTLSGARIISSAPWKRARSGARIIGSGYQTRGRFASGGRYRKIGFWGRYPGAGGPSHGGELKFHDIDWDQAAADTSNGVISNTSSLILIGQGVTESTRIGRKCTIRSIGWRAQLQLNGLLNDTGIQFPKNIRLMIVQDTQCNGAAPSVSGTNGVLETAHFQSFNNLANKGRFRVLYDKNQVINTLAVAGNGTANDSGVTSRHFTWFKKVNIPIEYSGNATPSVITEVRTNNIFGLIIANDTGATYTLLSKLRFRFSDD